MNASFELLHAPGAHAFAPHADDTAAAWSGPERRRDATPAARWLTMMLDEVGHGMLLLTDEAYLLHANHLARAELDPRHPLQLHGRQLRARDGRDESALREALGAAARGLRRMLTMGQGEQRASVAVVPLDPIDGQVLTLVSLGKRHLSHQLTLMGFAKCYGLTPAETRVLEGLCAGLEPTAIAALHGVGIATVRTQIACIRQKVGAADITALVRLVAQLPPMVSALRAALSGAPGANGEMRLSA